MVQKMIFNKKRSRSRHKAQIILIGSFKCFNDFICGNSSKKYISCKKYGHTKLLYQKYLLNLHINLNNLH